MLKRLKLNHTIGLIANERIMVQTDSNESTKTRTNINYLLFLHYSINHNFIFAPHIVVMLQARPIPHDTMPFHCQQSKITKLMIL